MKRLSIIALLLCIVTATYAVKPTTVEFAKIDGKSLYFDVYAPDDTTTNRPAVLFAFGGAFRGGHRDNKEYIEFFNFLADHGIVAVSTDYRTSLMEYLKPTSKPEDIAQAFASAVSDAVADFCTATGYLYYNAAQYGIDPTKIFASGSSAGAITALQAAYAMSDNTAAPQFQYAGVISFAGAIFSVGPLEWGADTCPMMLFHGNNDHNVPYNEISWGTINFIGSEPLAKSLADKGVPCELYIFDGIDHAVCHTPMTDNLYDILGFITRVSSGKEKLSIRAMICPPDMPKFTPPTITVEDIIKANL